MRVDLSGAPQLAIIYVAYNPSAAEHSSDKMNFAGVGLYSKHALASNSPRCNLDNPLQRTSPSGVLMIMNLYTVKKKEGTAARH